jgi:hypothetical protein
MTGNGTDQTATLENSQWLKADLSGGPQQVTVQLFVGNNLIASRTASVRFN